MNPTRLLIVFCFVTLCVQGAVPVKRPVATPAAVNPKAKIESAVQAKVTAYFKNPDRQVGSKGVYVQSVSIKILSTEPMQGWSGKYLTTGTAQIVLAGTGVGQKQERSFQVFTTVAADGSVTITDISG